MRIILFLCFSLSAQQITPNNVQPGAKQGNGSKFQLAGTVNGTAGSSLCLDNGGNSSTEGCTNGVGSVTSQHPAINASPTTGNIFLMQTSPVSVPYSATPTFDLSKGDLLTITLSGDVTTPIFVNGTPGGTFRLRICQDSMGGHIFSMLNSMTGAMAPGMSANKCSIQRFSVITTSSYQAEGPGIINQ
jgi:hypothetical protein